MPLTQQDIIRIVVDDGVYKLINGVANLTRRCTPATKPCNFQFTPGLRSTSLHNASLSCATKSKFVITLTPGGSWTHGFKLKRRTASFFNHLSYHQCLPLTIQNLQTHPRHLNGQKHRKGATKLPLRTRKIRNSYLPLFKRTNQSYHRY